MQVLIPCLILLVVENVQLVQNEHLTAHDVLDSTQFKNAVAKELLKKKLSTLESARQQGSLATFLRKRGKNLSGLRTAPKSSFHKDDDPSRKQAQMANTFIASSNLLFGTKSQQRKASNTGSKQTNKDVLDMRSLRQACSGYSEDGSEFTALKEAPKQALNKMNDSSSPLKKISNPKKAVQDPISCYLTEPKKVTCMHKDIIYKISLPSSEVADDEIGRIVESIYRAVEGKSNGKASLDEPIEVAAIQKTSQEDAAKATDSKKASSEDSLKKKRASDDYLRSLFFNNLLAATHKALPNYNSNNPVFIPLLIPMTQPKLDPPKAPAGYYTGLAIDPRLQIPMNLSVGVDPVINYQTDRNMMFENSYGQYLVPHGFPLPELNLKQRSQMNMTTDEEKRRNWLALMATNGLVPVENGVNPKVLTQNSINGEVQGIAEEKDSPGGNKLTVEETGEVLDKLLNKRQQRDTYFLRRQMRRKPIFEEKPTLTSFYGDGRKRKLTKVVKKLSDPGGYLSEEKKGCPCPCPCPYNLCASSKSPRKPTKSAPNYPLKIQVTTIQLPNGGKCCASTTKFPTNKCSSVKCSTCPEGCQPIQTTPYDTTSCKPFSEETDDRCGDSNILSKIVSGGMNRNNKEPQVYMPNSIPPLSQTRHSHQNWLPYSPQLIQQHQQQFTGQSHQSGQLEDTLKDQDNQQPYFASGNGVQIQYSATGNSKPLQYFYDSKDDHELAKSSELDSSGLSKQQGQYSGPFQPQDQPQFPKQKNIERNQIQVHYNHLPFGPGTSSGGSAQMVESKGLNDVGFKTNELQNEPILQAEHNNTASKQSDAKNKKHRDSFFARLRSKFHKGIPPNGTEQDNQYNHQDQHIQYKALLGTSIFKFGPKNQTSWPGKTSSATTSQSMDNQQCSEDRINQFNDQTVTLANQTQPSTVNNINITITSMQPKPGARGQIQSNIQTNQPPQSSKINVQCPNRIPPTTRAAPSGQNSRTCMVTKIWLCSQQSSNHTITSSNNTCTQPSTCQTKQTTTCQTTQSTCQATRPTTCRTSPSTCQTTTSSPSPSTQLVTCSNTWNSSNYNLEGADCTQPSTCDADVRPTSTCGSGISPGYLPPLHGNPWPPSDSQMPPGIPRSPPDTSQGSPEGKMKTFYNYGPYPVWNQWQYPMDRMNPHHPQQNLNWQQQTRFPLPTPYLPQKPQQTQREPKIPQPNPFTQGPHRKQADRSQPPISPRHQQTSWHQNLAQPQMQVPMWQAPSRQLELNSRGQNLRPSLPDYGDPSREPVQPIGTDLQYRRRMISSPYEEKDWRKANNNMVRDATREMRKAKLPANIKQHIARVRRYLLKKRPNMSKQSLAASP